MTGSAIVGKNGHGDIDMGANELFDSSVALSWTGNEESLMKKEKADSFKL